MTGTLLRKTLSAGSLGAMLAVLVVIGCFARVSKAQEAVQLSRARACLDTRRFGWPRNTSEGKYLRSSPQSGQGTTMG